MATTQKRAQSDRYVEFDEYIDYQLQKTRATIRNNDILTAVAGIVTLNLGYVLIFLFLDQWIVEGGLSVTARSTMLGFLILLTTGWAAWKIVIPSWRQVSSLFAAAEIERHEPAFKSTLLNLIDLNRHSRKAPRAIRTTMEKRAARKLSKMEVDYVVDRLWLMRLAYILMFLVAALCLYALSTPKRISSSLWRAVAPFSELSVATQTEILRVTPGDAEILSRTQLEVMTELRGEIPESIRLIYSTDDGSFEDEELLMEATKESPREFRATITGVNARGIMQNLTYRVEANDAVSPRFRVTVNHPPTASVTQIRYDFPTYMKFEPRIQPDAHIDTWEGTKVTISAETSQSVTTARLLLSDTDSLDAPTTDHRMKIVDGTRLQVTLKEEIGFREDGTAPRFYRIVCRNERGDSDPNPSFYPIVIHPDQAPHIRLLDPKGDLQRPANAIVPLLIQASDPDFHLRFITLRVEKGEDLILSEPVFDGSTQMYEGRFDLELASLNLQAGERIDLWLEARDNKEPLGNRNTTPKITIEIVEPVTEEEVERELQDQKEKQDELLDQLKQERTEEQVTRENLPEDAEQQDQGDVDSENETGSDGNESSDEGNDEQSESASENPSSEEESESGNSSQNGSDTGEDSANQTAEDGQPQGLRNDGTDDDKALQKLIERQQQKNRDGANGDQSPEDETGHKNPRNGSQKGNQPNDSNPANQPPSEQNGNTANQNSGEQNPREQGNASHDQTATNDVNESSSDVNSSGEGSQEGVSDGQNPNSGDPGNGNQKSDARPGQTTAGESDNPSGNPGETEPEGDANSNGKNENGMEQAPNDESNGNSPVEKADGPLNGDEKRPTDQTGVGNRTENSDPNDPRNGEPNRNPDGSSPRDNGESPMENPSTTPPKNGEQSENQPGESESSPNGNPETQPGDASQQPKNGAEGTQQQSNSPRQDFNETNPPNSHNQNSNAQNSNVGEAEPPNSQDQNPGQSDSTGELGDGSTPEKGPGEANDGSAPNAPASENEPPGDGPGTEGEGEGSRPGSPSTEENPQGNKSGDGNQDNAAQNSNDSKAQNGNRTNQPGGTRSAGGDGVQRGNQQSGSGGDAGQNVPEQENLDDLRQATDLALKRLEEELDRGEVDEKLLDDMGWNADDARNFVDRLRKQMQQNQDRPEAENQARKLQFEEMLKNLKIGPNAEKRSGDGVKNRPSLETEQRRIVPPPEYREAYDAFTRSLKKAARESTN